MRDGDNRSKKQTKRCLFADLSEVRLAQQAVVFLNMRIRSP